MYQTYLILPKQRKSIRRLTTGEIVQCDKIKDEDKFGGKTYEPTEIAIRFKYSLVTIHCFPNGNGRHARLCADILIRQMNGQDGFTWGSENLYQEGELRSAYINALKLADAGDYKPLIEFACS